MLHLDYDITGLRGADYNPRVIGDDDISALAESIKTLGLVKPLIVRGDLLVAGHQRTKALRRIGKTTAAVYVLPAATTTYDEVRFNQLHNGTDMDYGDENVTAIGGFESLGFQVVDPSRLSGNMRAKMAPVRKEICELILSYGPWGASVATKSGRIIHCAQYALSAIATRTPLTCYVIPDEDVERYQAFLSRQYGQFSYAHLPKDTYIQTFAQMFRLREGEDGRMVNKSNLYETVVIPWLQQNPKARILDFGSGQGDYAAKLRKAGYSVNEIEFFRRCKGKMAIDISAVNQMIDKTLASYSQAGPFDAVVCDSVMNSVDCTKAETSVMTLLNAFCKKGGHVFFSGRKRDELIQLMEKTKNADKERSRRRIEFIDQDGLSAIYQKGRWFYQKYHTKEQAHTLALSHGLRPVRLQWSSSSSSWQMHSKKAYDLPEIDVREAALYEFNLPVSDNRLLNRHADAINTLLGEDYED